MQADAECTTYLKTVFLTMSTNFLPSPTDQEWSAGTTFTAPP